jgi:hypothetical protein
VHFKVKLLVELPVVSEDLNPSFQRGLLSVAKSLYGTDINGSATRYVLKSGQTDDVVLVLSTYAYTRGESDLRNSSVERHLTSLESSSNSTTTSRGLSLASLSGGLSMTRALSTSYAGASLASPFVRLQVA